ncbi:MAG: hypothetical protein V7K20_29635 [Nostoc sp.]
MATKKVDAGVSSASIASAFGLGFIPLHKSRSAWSCAKPRPF